MTILNEIGIENEYWLVDSNGTIIEAPKYNFPADEMGFLVELRSDWGSDPDHIVSTLEESFLHQKAKARALGFTIECEAYKNVSEEWMAYISNKYNHNEMEDFTRNIHGATYSHHTGLLAGRATSGCHVHFSRWDTKREAFTIFQEDEIRYVVNRMDKKFAMQVGKVARILGEWEPKEHGFEYRSLPCTVTLIDVARTALNALNEL